MPFFINNKVIWQPADGPEKVEIYHNDHDYIYRKQLDHFFDCIENNKSPSVSLNDGVAVLRMIDSAKESYRTGKRIALA